MTKSDGSEVVVSAGGWDGTTKNFVAVYDVQNDAWNVDDPLPQVSWEKP